MNFKQYIKENADERERVFEKLQNKIYKHGHDFRSIVQCITRYVQKHNLI
jgi:hypothetical protein